MGEQAYPSALQEKKERLLANNEAVAAGGTIGPSTADFCKEWLYWGFSCYANNVGQVDVEYSYDSITWRVLDQVVIIAGAPNEKIYPVDRFYYRVTFTDTADDSGQEVDLSTFKRNNL